ncbi:MAG: hypothetical protein ACD_10C00442G0002 [uncultured bacterium]|nr:MAG: hypothetical protein ACD_10C00442G0002 [uncultured bacterium]
MKSKHGFNFLLLVGHRTMVTDQQPAAAEHHVGRLRHAE